MKRLLALILSLILCFSLLVSCNKEKEQSSSSSSSGEESTTIKEELINECGEIVERYYYRSPSYKILNEYYKDSLPTIHMVYDKEGLEKKLQDLGAIIDEPHLITEKIFENNYVFVVEECKPRDYMRMLMGYKDIVRTEDGYVLSMDMVQYYETQYINEAGEVTYGYTTPEPSSEMEKSYFRLCYAIVIPKSEFETEPSEFDIVIQPVVHNFVVTIQ